MRALKFIKIGLILTSTALFFSGCISNKTDAFLLGAGIGAGATYYFMNDGKIFGYSKSGIQSQIQGKRPKDVSIPADLEWYYFEEDLRREQNASF
ncbi:hypothetical protein B6S12_02195 [Helicobacter valdiviensis]|uniref:Lipoprotein n=1 Tax=Helicobacter valdiviensis TaxID=1458358 RepID=A0A2W6PPM1_9HELI|nr:hypothetical protein [Helicobacter valdiviensis]PZT48673.1 hypothetical protein B6S12_02195 [Helicobacter valdiviensis]